MAAGPANHVRIAACGLLILLAMSARGDVSSRADVRTTWREQHLRGYDGIVVYRATVRVDPSDPGLLVGAPAYGGYEIFAGGRLIGRSRGWSSRLPFGYGEVFRVPREVIGNGGAVDLTLRARRIG